MFRFFIFSFCYFFTFLGVAQNDSYYKYIENKGQWPDQVLYKCELENGNLFLEKNGIKFNFWDNSDLVDQHTHYDPSKDTIITYGHVYEVVFLENSADFSIETKKKTKEYFNYLLGNDNKKWAGGCHGYGEVIYKNLYPGIDFKMYSNDFFLKYDLVVSPHADLNSLQMQYQGQDNIHLDNGRLIIALSINEIIEQKPVAWQIIDGEKSLVKCNYRLHNNIVSFEIPDGYNPNYELIIDPELIFSTYSGSTSDNFGYTATYDNSGFLYSGSSVFGLYGAYPTTLGAYQTDHAGGVGSVWFLGGTDIAITKYDTTGTFRVYSTYLGGSADELPHSLVVNNQNELYIYGTTSSADFPMVDISFDNSFAGGTPFSPGGVGVDFENGTDIVVAKLSNTGESLLAATYLGGTENDGINNADNLAFNYADEMRGEILIDTDNSVYVVSSTLSNDFPIVAGFQSTIGGGQDACIVKMNADLSQIMWSSFLGGNSNDAAYSIAILDYHDIVVAGGTESTNFPVSENAYQTSFGGGSADGFLIKIEQDGANMIEGTYYGSDAYDQLYFVEVDLDNQIFVYGQTLAADSFFIDNAAYGQPNSGMLISKFDLTLENRVWSTVFGTGTGKCNLSPTAFLVDVCNRIYLSGWGGATNASNPNTDLVTGMDVSDDAYQSTTDGSDFYLLVIDSDANDIIYATFFGGSESHEHVDGGTSRFSPDGTIYQSVCAGCGGHSDFPIYPTDAVSPTNNSFAIVNGDSIGLCNNAVFKMKFGFPTVSAVFEVPAQYCLNEAVPMINNSASDAEYTWDFGDNSPLSNEQFPIHTYADTGSYIIELTAYNAECNVTVNSFQTINIISEEISAMNDLDLCQGDSTTIGPELINSNYEYLWSPTNYLSSSTIANPVASPTENIDYTLVIHHDGCVDSVYQHFDVFSPTISLPEDFILCEPEVTDIQATASSDVFVEWYVSENPNDTIASGNLLTHFINENTTIFATATTHNCMDIDTIQISVLADEVQITPDFTACANDTILLEVINPNNQLTFHWSPESLVLTGQNTPQITSVLEQLTMYTVTANYDDLCTVSDQVVVNVSGINSNEIEATASPNYVLAGQEVQLNAMPSGYTYLWSPSASVDDASSQSPLATPEENTTFVVQLLDGNCTYSANVKVKVYDFVCGNPTIYVPNAFTPNNNGENEKIWVRGNNLTSIYFVIYDRWGEKIFETTDQSIGWDGTFEGENLDPAVFVYYLEAVCSDGQEYFEKGNISLIR